MSEPVEKSTKVMTIIFGVLLTLTVIVGVVSVIFGGSQSSSNNNSQQTEEPLF